MKNTGSPSSKDPSSALRFKVGDNVVFSKTMCDKSPDRRRYRGIVDRVLSDDRYMVQFQPHGYLNLAHTSLCRVISSRLINHVRSKDSLANHDS